MTDTSREAVERLIAEAEQMDRINRAWAAEPNPMWAPFAATLRALLAEKEALQQALSRRLVEDFAGAFAKAREMGMTEFWWNGGRYHTRTAEEEAARRAEVPASERRG